MSRLNEYLEAKDDDAYIVQAILKVAKRYPKSNTRGYQIGSAIRHALSKIKTQLDMDAQEYNELLSHLQ